MYKKEERHVCPSCTSIRVAIIVKENDIKLYTRYIGYNTEGHIRSATFLPTHLVRTQFMEVKQNYTYQNKLLFSSLSKQTAPILIRKMVFCVSSTFPSSECTYLKSLDAETPCHSQRVLIRSDKEHHYILALMTKLQI